MAERRDPEVRRLIAEPRRAARTRGEGSGARWAAEALAQVETFSRVLLHRELRAYQSAAARAIVQAVLAGRGGTFAVTMARQAGKNETAAHVEAYLLNAFSRVGGYLVKASPTFRPQSLVSMQRLGAVLAGSALGRPAREQGYILRLGNARALFFSASRQANVVGATANILLEADEAQEIDETKWNKDFRPMGSSTNAVTVLWGTAWTSETLLSRTIRALRWEEARDGVQRVFRTPWEEVAAAVPAYGDYVRGEIDRLGAQHPLIRTQYCLEEIDDEAAMFPAATRALMRGSHPRQRTPTEGRAYCLLVDVAGEAEEQMALPGLSLRDALPRKDSTALTVVECSRNDLDLPRYLVVDRYLWTGTPHHTLYGAIAQLAEVWSARKVVVDATGLGAGLASLLRRALGDRVVPFTFSAASKSDLGWAFLGLCGSGRFLDHRDDGSPEQAQFWREVEAAGYEVLDGPNRRMRWGVADPTIHDDLLISAALCAALEEEGAAPSGPTHLIEAPDPLARRGRRREGEDV